MELYLLAFHLTLFTMFLTTRGPGTFAAPVKENSQGRPGLNDQQLVVNDNTQSVTLSDRKPPPAVVKNARTNTSLSQHLNSSEATPQSAQERDTSQWNVENVVTSDNNQLVTTWQPAVTHNDDVNNAPGNVVVGTTGVAIPATTTTIPAPQHNNNDHGNGTRSKGRDGSSGSDTNLKPRAGLIQPQDNTNQQNIFLEPGKVLHDVTTASDYVIPERQHQDVVTTLDDSDISSGASNSDVQWITTVPSAVSTLRTEEYTTKDTTNRNNSSVLDSTTGFSVRLPQGNRTTTLLQRFTDHSATTSVPQIKTRPAATTQSVLSTQSTRPSILVTVLLSSVGTELVPHGAGESSSPELQTLQNTTPLGQGVSLPSGSGQTPTATSPSSASIDNEGQGQTSNPGQSLGSTTTGIHLPSQSSTTPGQIPRSSSQGQGQPIPTSTQSVQNHPSTTTMVYVASSDVTHTGTSLFDGFDGLDGSSEFQVKDIILGVSGTVGCMLTLCMLVAFTRCCCKKQKDSDDEEETGGTAAKGTFKALRSLGRKSKRHGNATKDNAVQTGGLGGRDSATDTTQVSVECHSDGKRLSWCHPDGTLFNGKDGKNSLLRASQKKEISVRDRIAAFEAGVPGTGEVRMRDAGDGGAAGQGGKPRRKKPKSKAFEDFESQGILIGFGNAPRRRPLDDGSTLDTEELQGEEGEEDDQLNLSHSFSNSRASEEAEDDDFEAVQRNTEILKSFRRAPPPKNRSRARRSGRRGRQQRPAQNQETRSEGGRDTGDGASVTEGGSVYSAPAYTTTPPGGGSTPDDTTTGSQDSDLDQFEASLHMSPIGRSNSAAGVLGLPPSPRRGQVPRTSNGATTPQSDRGGINSAYGGRFQNTNGAREIRGQFPRIIPHDTANNGKTSSQGRTVTIQVPASHRNQNDNGGGDPSSYRSNGFHKTGGHFLPGEARRIQPEGESEHEPCDSDFRQRCHSDSSSRTNTGHPGSLGGQGSISAQGSLSARGPPQSSRPVSCYTGLDSTGSKITGLPPKGLPINPRLYPNRLERTPLLPTNTHPSGGDTSSYPHPSEGSAPPPSYLKQMLPPLQQQQQHPQQQPVAMDSLRHVMMRRWDSEHSGLHGDQLSHNEAPSHPIGGGSTGLHRAPAAGSNPSTENIFEGHFPRSERLVRKFNSADSMNSLDTLDSPARLYPGATAPTANPAAQINDAPQ